MAFAMNAGHIECNIIGDIGLDDFFTTRPGDEEMSSISKLENVAETFFCKDGSAHTRIENEFQRELSIQNHGNDHKIVGDLNGKPYPALTICQTKAQLRTTPDWCNDQ